MLKSNKNKRKGLRLNFSAQLFLIFTLESSPLSKVHGKHVRISGLDGGQEAYWYRSKERKSRNLANVVAGFSEFGYDFVGVVVAAGFEVELDAADLDGVFKVQAVMEDVENVGFLLGNDAHELP